MDTACRRLLLRGALALLAVPFAALAGPPITIGDGSVCINDFRDDLPDTNKRHERQFRLKEVWVDTSPSNKRCEDQPTDCPGCRKFGAEVKDVVVEYKEGTRLRQVVASFENGNVAMSMTGPQIGDWDPPRKRARHKRNRNGKIARILVDGEPIECPNSGKCRVTFVDANP